MHESQNHQDPKRDQMVNNIGVAVADLIENVIANALKIAEDVANDSARVARSARQFVRDLEE